ncbi:MAG: glutamyl-tRNA amidotransferase [Deltaproteobacteria bacterium RIFCSPLOWO2_12_FULL_43_16]|nr:MAG: glutamyl-tRNA amidotransferase [Deltaproteobacteria bacterium RIFCSPHIGHO2_02_FULL_43_33]OGQ37594.1 MAG: glutamyl-tRNA amidotransferase [Deltaproteobacteria bacterium RIFCSPLOWO2_01_FULL_42_9]OGQ61298.1 MAG: glutamyl-tRNA amidotransferase [Deltaproteobacteria bacterium RIFCSPLOWO2_12_FULL_43_16]HBR16794.1 glutamyl-tRNA amidotransferase [Deltaproteobacteria bacterium]
MSIKAELVKQMNEAAKAQDKIRLGALRNILAQVKNKEIALIKRTEGLSDEEVVSVIKTMVKQSLESIDQFKKGGRQDLVDKEEAELKTLRSFLPPQLSKDEIKVIVSDIVKNLKASGPKDMGKVMKEVMPRVAGKADGKLVNEVVKEVLGN